MRRTVLLLATTALALIAAGGIALAATFTCTTNPCDGTTDDDVITGTVNAETINGRAGNDEISARDANDTLNGEDGNDTLLGENGTDRLNGGAGNDTLNGSPSNPDTESLNAYYDYYLLTPNWGQDTITDSRGRGVISVADAASGAAMPNLTVNLVSDPTRPEVSDGNGNTVNWETNDVMVAITGARDDVISQRPKASNGLNGGAGSDTYTGYTSDPTGADSISDPSGTADVLDLSSRSLESARWTTPYTSNARTLRLDFHGGFFLCIEENCDYIDIAHYFDNTSPDVCASGPGPGVIETIKFALPDDQVGFEQVKNFASRTDGIDNNGDGNTDEPDETCPAPPEEDTGAPTVTNVVPTDGEQNVATGTNIEASFSEAMDASTSDGDASTIDGTTFTLTKPDGPDADTNPDPVAGVVSYDSATNRATLDPTADLDYSTTYTATVTTGAEDLAGNQLDQDPNSSGNQPRTWSLTTAAPPPPDTTSPTVQIISPSHGARGVVRTTMVTAQFSEDVDGVMVDTFMLGKGKLSSSQLTSATKIASGTNVSYEPATKTATLDPYGSSAAKLATCQWYTAKVTSGIEDKAGNPAVERMWSFKTRSC